MSNIKERIIEQSSVNINDLTMYNLLKGAGRTSLKDVIDEDINIKEWVKYHDIDSKGNEVVVLSIIDNYDCIYTTTSPTFIREFDDMIDVLGNVKTITVLSGTSKAGRTFLTCKPIE